MPGFAEYDRYDALGLAELVRRREVSSRELVDEALARIDAHNPRLNAIVIRMDEHAREVASLPLPEGPFTGVPFLLKDLLAAYAGVPLTSSCRFYEGFVPDYDSELVQRYKRAGLVVAGKTNTPELGIVAYTEPETRGPTHTPWRLGHTSGGSSGGSGAAVGARIVPMAHGGDGGGSIRIPASCCGIFGYKPTRGMTPAGPDASEHWNGFAIEHALTLSVRDSAALLDATAGPSFDDWYYVRSPERSFAEAATTDPKPLRIAVSTRPHLPGRAHPDCVRAVDEAAKLCEALGHHVEEADLTTDPAELARDFLTTIAVSTAAAIELAAKVVDKEPSPRHFETATWLLAMMGRQTSALEHQLALERLQGLARSVGSFHTRYDVMLTPTLGKPPVRIGELMPTGLEAAAQRLIANMGLSAVLRMPGLIDKLAEKVYAFVPYTPLANVTGQPSMSMPLFWNEDELPIGTMFTARAGDDATLFSLAGQLERARPWRDRRPPLLST